MRRNIPVLTGELQGSHDPGGVVFTVLAALSGMEREYIRDRTLEGHESARKRGKGIGGASVTDDDMLGMALHLRDQELSLREIAIRRRPAPATQPHPRLSHGKRCRHAKPACPRVLNCGNGPTSETGVNTSGSTSGATPGAPVQTTVQTTLGASPEGAPHYATFWQQFLWGWGGFYLKDRAGEEFEWMAEYSGIPADKIPTALEAFDRFFPIPNDWLTTPGSTDIHMLKMVPLIFQGIGAHQRRIQYKMVDNLAALQPSAQYTIPDLAKRISCAVDFLL